MRQEGNAGQFFTAESVAKLPIRERVGLSIEASDASDALTRIHEAEDAGIRQVWMILSGGGRSDVLTIYGAAALETSRIRLGTSIVQIYPRHPLVTAQQALAVNDIAPGRLRLGVGTSSRPSMKPLGISMHTPISYLNEYVDILRGVLWEGKVSHQGKFFNVEMAGLRKAKVPILVSALGEKAFRNAGEISDGVISWLSPVPYLLNKAVPEFHSGAKSRKRPVPPMVAHIQVSLSENQSLVHAATKKRLDFYLKLPFYTNMFRAAGLPVSEDGSGVDLLVDNLVVSGSEDKVKKQLLAFLSSGLDELLITLVHVSDEKSERKRLLSLIGSL